MFRTLTPSLFLRRVLWADALVSAVVGGAMAAAAPLIESLTRLPAGLLVPAGLVLLPYAAGLVWLATRPAVPSVGVWVSIVSNLAWAIGCAELAFGAERPAGLGLVFLALQAVTVLVFAELEFTGLRRTPLRVAA